MSPLASGGRDRYSFELALDRYVCYPMESVELTVRVRLENPMRTILCLHLPQKTEITAVHMDDVDDNYLTVYTHDFDGKLLAIQLYGAGTVFRSAPFNSSEFDPDESLSELLCMDGCGCSEF